MMSTACSGACLCLSVHVSFVIKLRGGKHAIMACQHGCRATPVSVVAATAVPSLQTCQGTAGRRHCSGGRGPAPSQSGLRAALGADTGPAAAPALKRLALVRSVSQSGSQSGREIRTGREASRMLQGLLIDIEERKQRSNSACFSLPPQFAK